MKCYLKKDNCVCTYLRKQILVRCLRDFTYIGTGAFHKLYL